MKNETNKNIGGGIFGSSCERILKPVQTDFGTLAVVPLEEEDTHALMLEGVVIAKHPNGYSCHTLGERMEAGHPAIIQQQLEYIVDCGGYAISWEEVEKLLENKC